MTGDIVTAHLKHGWNGINRPKLLVVHAMGEFIVDGQKHYHAVEWLDHLELSAHVLAAPDGTRFRCRKDAEGAYHAKGFNMDSLGIEVLVPGEHDYASFLEAIKHPYVSDAQYSAVLEQCRKWLDAYQIERVARHCDISPGRKVDPGAGFPWADLLHDLRR